jgi:type IX secretion system PorP/SprF family membrane protein
MLAIRMKYKKMKLRKVFAIIAISAIATVCVQGQQKPVYSQYMFNTFLVNPAAAGAEGLTAVNLTGRTQWQGIQGSPKTESVSAQTRILKNSFIAKALNLRKKFSKRSRSGRIGVGAYVYNDTWGPIRRTGTQLTYAYHIPLRQSQLSFGMSFAGYQFKVNKADINDNVDPNDAVLMQKLSMFIPDANFGVQYTTPVLYVGFSVADMFESSLKLGDIRSQDFRMLRTYNLMGGYKIEINRLFMVEPSAMIKIGSNAFQMDMSARAYYRERYWGGLSYRTGAGGGAFIILLGMKMDKYYIGYAFDYTLSPIMKYTLGSHELMFSVKFGENARRYRWLNRY